MFWAYNANSPQIDIILCKEVSCLLSLHSALEPSFLIIICYSVPGFDSTRVARPGECVARIESPEFKTHRIVRCINNNCTTYICFDENSKGFGS